MNFFISFASRRSRLGQIFHSIRIGLISPVRLAFLTYHEFSVMLRLLTVAPLSSTIFEFMDCVEIVLDVDKPLGAR